MSPDRPDPRAARTALVFPGVGVRPCGHEIHFLKRHRELMQPFLDRASEYAGIDVLLALEAPPERLTELQGQLFTYAFNTAVANVYLAHGIRPQLMAGHSMGIYSALTTSGALTFRDGLVIVAAAYHTVAHHARGLDCAMAVIVGLDQAEIDELLASRPATDTVMLVNSNNDTTKIFAGLRSDLESFVAEAKSRDALKARLLPVTSPYHHATLLKGASASFEVILRQHEWRRPQCPIVSSIDQRLLTEGSELLELTAQNIATPIDWEKVIETLIEQRIELLLECGAGISLSQNGRLIPDCPQTITVKNAQRRAGL